MRFSDLDNIVPRDKRGNREKQDRFEVLARYNAEVERGILHTDEWQQRMMSIQAEFDAWITQHSA